MTSKEILEEFSQINFKENATEKDKIDVIENSDLNVTKILSQNTLKKKSNTPERSTVQSIQEQFFIQQQEANYNLKHDLNQVSTNVGQIQNISDTFPQEPSNFNLNSVNIPNMLYVQSPPFTESEPTQAHHSSIEYLKKKKNHKFLTSAF